MQYHYTPIRMAKNFLKTDHTRELKNILTEMKNKLEGINSRLGDTEECISDLEDRIMEITQSK